MEILYITLYLIMAYIIGHFVYVFFVKDNSTNDTEPLPIVLLSLVWPITLIVIILSVLSPHLVKLIEKLKEKISLDESKED